MSDQPANPPSRLSLSVLPNSGKIDQLKREMREVPLAPSLNVSIVDPSREASKTARQIAIEEKVVEAIREVFDPELPVNIFDLGLVYDIEVNPETDAVRVKMTLTAPGCPVAGTLPAEVQRRVGAVPEVSSAVVELVWEPAWTKARMSEAALLELGLL